MGKGRYFLERLRDESAMGLEVMPGCPIVEISGERRVLIENHLGVKAYSMEKILVKVKYGGILVCGSGLCLARMTREQLVIQGRIDAVTLQRRG